MKTIWKFEVPVLDRVAVGMPKGARILSAQTQHGTLCIWAECESNNSPEIRTFRIVGTGHTLDFDLDKSKYIATFQLYDGELVFHIYEILE